MLFDKLDLISLVALLHKSHCIIIAKLEALELIALLGKLLHLCFDLFKIGRRKGLCHLEIIIEAGLGSGTSCKLSLGIKVLYSLCHKVCGSVTEGLGTCL